MIKPHMKLKEIKRWDVTTHLDHYHYL